jgi:hypothetical protein
MIEIFCAFQSLGTICLLNNVVFSSNVRLAGAIVTNLGSEPSKTESFLRTKREANNWFGSKALPTCISLSIFNVLEPKINVEISKINHKITHQIYGSFLLFLDVVSL